MTGHETPGHCAPSAGPPRTSISRRRAVGLALAGAAAAALEVGRPSGSGPAAASSATTADTADVLDFGAVGDGATDDAQAFQAAMDSLGVAGGGVLIIPAGTYLINNIVQLRDNVTIIGHGAILTKTAGPYSLFVSLSGKEQGYGSGVRNVAVSGLTFLGPPYDERYLFCPFALHHAQDVTVEECAFIQTQGIGHNMDLCGCKGITVRNCVFRGAYNSLGTPGYNKAETIQLDQSRPGSLTYDDHPDSYDALYTRDVVVENCRFEPLEFHGDAYPCPNPIGAHAVRENHFYENVTFTGNIIIDPVEDPSNDDLDEEPRKESFKGVLHFPAVRNLTIEGNQFTLSMPRSVRVVSIFSVDYGPLDLDPRDPAVQDYFDPIASEAITIRNNTFSGFMPSADNVAQEAIWIRGVPDGEVRDVEISGNTMTDLRAEDGRGAVTISALHCTQLTVSDNEIVDTVSAVRLSATRIFHITGNRFLGDLDDPECVAITVTDGSSAGTISANEYQGFSTGVDDRGAGRAVRVIERGRRPRQET